MRLTKEVRYYIARSLVSKAESEFSAKLAADCDRLVDDVIQARLGEDFNKLADIPDGWLERPRQLVIAGMPEHRPLLSLTTSLRVPRCAWEGRASDLPPDLVERLVVYSDAVDNHQNTRAALARKVNAALSGFHTVAKLKDAWPEAYELIPEEMLGAATKLPAVQLGDLKAQLAAFSVKKAAA